MINLTKCEDCMHNPVCKDTSDYTRIFNLLNDFDLRDFIDGELRCKHYSKLITGKENN